MGRKLYYITQVHTIDFRIPFLSAAAAGKPKVENLPDEMTLDDLQAAALSRTCM
jgi:hypothetical protein